MYDRICSEGHQMVDCWEPVTAPEVACVECGAQTTRAWLQRAAAVTSDDIPGGILIKNGLCWPDGTPRKFYSKSELYREAERQGYVNRVEHKGSKGSDKNPNTTRWV